VLLTNAIEKHIVNKETPITDSIRKHMLHKHILKKQEQEQQPKQLKEMTPPPATNSSYISITDLQKTLTTGKCQCEVCKAMRYKQYRGKPLCTIEEIKQMQAADKRAQINRQKIQIINNEWCVCQRCGAHVKLLPEIQVPATKRESELKREVEQLRERLDKHEIGKEKLSLRQLASTKSSIQWRLKELKEESTQKKMELQKRIPLYRRGESWVCFNCWDNNNKGNNNNNNNS
jgi:hypothetical protein